MSNRVRLGEFRDRLRALKLPRRRTDLPLKELGTVLSDILRQPAPDLQREMDELWACVDATKNPIKAVFAPKRFSSASQIARLWWLQLLVMVAQAKGPWRWVVPRALDKQGAGVSQAIAEAKAAWQSYTAQQGSAVLDHLADAIECLQNTMPEGLSFDGRYVVVDGVKINRPLTPKERQFLQLLIAADGKTVTKSDLAKKGLTKAHQIKSRLLAKREFADLEDHIVADQGSGYRLI